MSRINAATIFFSLPLEKGFQYLIPPPLKVKQGMRVLVDFRGRKRVGIVANLDKDVRIKKIKPIIEALDIQPSLLPQNIKFAQALRKIYPYALGEFLFMMLPPYLRKIRNFSFKEFSSSGSFPRFAQSKEKMAPLLFIKRGKFTPRYEVWRDKAKESLKEGSVLICFPQISYLKEAKEIIEKDFSKPLTIIHSRLKEKELFMNWAKTRRGSLVLGTRAAIFYYPWDVRLIVIEEENSPFYYQEEKPFYHLLNVTYLFHNLTGTDIIFSGDYPTLNSYKLIEEKKMQFYDSKEEAAGNIKVVNFPENKRKKIITPVFAELLRKNIEEGRRSVVVYNRRGFAPLLVCSSCGFMVRCQACSGSLRLFHHSYQDEAGREAKREAERLYLRKEGKANQNREGICSYCGKRAVIPQICTNCNSGYIRSFGTGIERIGVILKRIFPEVKISKWEERANSSQIILSTSQILSYLYSKESFDSGFVLDSDFWLSRLDYDAAFSTFLYLKKLSLLFRNTLYVFTRNSNHYLFRNIQEGWSNFYKQELLLRKKLHLPPYGFIAKITLRAESQNKLFKKAEYLYNSLRKNKLEVYGPFEEHPFKLRGKYRYSLMIKTKHSSALRKILTSEIKGLRTSRFKLAIEIK